ncbi:hypothetical protein SAMN06265182_1361 [Persephonella hydrogeniphila]|uniref:VCBS repeat-containing protein n=1 Tax=Persephonella hydrogeniphila TaxID=198703 RepID=A0A285NGN2_9AQUI|nr:hypothetical protein [Persephonella hydrogeniphila]SNZ08615.1 hypothetical protein SAMN06265182_1361 [Persephonella hydrogeniphila]
MKIQDYDIGMYSKSNSVNFSYQTVSLRIINSQNHSNLNLSIKLIKLDSYEINISQNSKTAEELKQEIIRLLIEKITGKKIKIVSLSELEQKSFNPDVPEIPQTAGELDIKSFNYSYEMVRFRANGFIKTQDGKQIKFDIFFEISKQSLKMTDINLKFGDKALIDPLIVNFDGNFSDILSDMKFDFDIDSDGEKERIPLLNYGRGFLVFDKNKNGRIDNGEELFGATTGDGFKELSVYDEDKNSWIDENDSIFDKLGVWVKNKNEDKIYSLKEKNIGAIYLKHLKTPFMYDNGVLSQSGIYITEDLNQGFLSKVDFTV